MPKDKGMFGPPKHKDLAKIITLRSINAVRQAAKKLLSMFKRAKTRKRKLVIKRAVVLASNRALVFTKRKDIKPATRKRMQKIAQIYRALAKKMKLD